MRRFVAQRRSNLSGSIRLPHHSATKHGGHVRNDAYFGESIMNQNVKEIPFETALKKLETIVENLENGDLSLEDALKQYEEGVRMADLCTKRLTEAEKKVEVLMKMNPGKFKTVPFEESSETKTKKKK